MFSTIRTCVTFLIIGFMCDMFLGYAEELAQTGDFLASDLWIPILGCFGIVFIMRLADGVIDLAWYYNDIYQKAVDLDKRSINQRLLKAAPWWLLYSPVIWLLIIASIILFRAVYLSGFTLIPILLMGIGLLILATTLWVFLRPKDI